DPAERPGRAVCRLRPRRQPAATGALLPCRPGILGIYRLAARGGPIPDKIRQSRQTMNYVKLGRTGLDVSRICLGCMSYGGGDQGNHAWSLGEEESRPFIKRALEAGINFFDTANRYSLGSSEEILGRAVKDFARRDEIVIATKVYGRMRPGPNGAGLSRKAIM